jgi:hypothetical protein
MANHLHKQIRDALKTALTGLTTTGARAYANRLQPMTDATLPGLRIFLDTEEAQGVTIHQPQVQERTLQMVVECCAKAVSGLDDALDQISKEVEVALAAGITIGSKSLQVFYEGMEFTDEQSDKPVGVKRLRFSVPYTAMSNAPDVLI